jgi:hypothetical protein
MVEEFVGLDQKNLHTGLAYAGALAGGASLPTYTVLEAVDLRWLQMVGHAPALVGIVGVPTAVGIAITRYRLYDIDILINRTLVYGTLTTTLIALYFGGIVVLQRLFVVLTGQQSTLAVVASTLLIAALFNPLRRCIQTFIDRRFYRRKYDARKTLGSSPESSVISSKPDFPYLPMSITPFVSRSSKRRCSRSSSMSR